jgi:hypothetical protein
MSRDGRDGGVAVYVTSHGFGHLNRTAAVVNRIPRGIPVSIRSHASLFDHWRQRVTRPIELGEFVSDSGAVNPPGDSNTTDGRASIELAIKVRAEAMARLDGEVDWLRKQRIAAIACDAPAVPLVAASRAGIPGFVMSNFTWADIYAPHARALGGDAHRLIADLRSDYRHATALFRMQPALKMSWMKPAIDVGLVVNQGRKRRGELARSLGLSRGDRVVYLYIGRYGQVDMDWARLERFGERGIHFVGYDPAPGVGPRNLHVVPSPDWPGGDLIASTDAVVAKAGYSTVGEAMASGTPMIYAPRRGFAEFRSLDQALRSWEGGVPVSSRDFQGFRLEAALEKALAIRPGAPPLPADGAARVARHLAQASRDPAAALGLF